MRFILWKALCAAVDSGFITPRSAVRSRPPLNTQIFAYLCARRAVTFYALTARPPIVVSPFEARQRQPKGSSLQVHQPDVGFGCDNAYVNQTIITR
jgi:hypothetical protein